MLLRDLTARGVACQDRVSLKNTIQARVDLTGLFLPSPGGQAHSQFPPKTKQNKQNQPGQVMPGDTDELQDGRKQPITASFQLRSQEAHDIAQQVKLPVAKTDHLSSVPGTQKLDGDHHSPCCGMGTHACTHTPTHRHTEWIKLNKKCKKELE